MKRSYLAIIFAFIGIIIPFNAHAESSPTFQESIQQAIDHAADPNGWIAPAGSIVLVPDTDGTHGLVYTDPLVKHNLIVRSCTKSTFFTSSDYAGKNHTIFQPTPPKYNADFVTTGNDATNFLDNNGVTGASTGVTGLDVIKLLERGLGINSTGTHDAIVEYVVESDGAGVFVNKLMRPMKNPDITSYSQTYTEYADLADFQKPADMTNDVFTNFKNFYDYWRQIAYYNADPDSDFPWTQLGYTYFWGNGYSLTNIQGMTEFILLGGTVVKTYGMYATQSYIYTKNSGQYGNGYASFDVYGNCDTIWAGHRFQTKTLSQADGTNTIVIENTGSVSGGQGILVYSLNYNVTNNGSVTGSTSTKFGISNTSNIALLFLGNTDSTYITAPTGSNTLTNSGTISSPGIAIEIDNGSTAITNNTNGTISGSDTAILSYSASPQTVTVDSSGTIYGGNYAIQTYTSDDTVTITGGKVTGSIDLGGGTDELDVTGATSDVTLSFVLNRNTGNTAKVDNVKKVVITDNKATIAPVVGGTDNVRDNDSFLIINAGTTLTADSTKIGVQNDSTHPMLTFTLSQSGKTISAVATRDNSYYTNNCGNSSLGANLDTLANNATSSDIQAVIGSLDGSGSASNALELQPLADYTALQASFDTAGKFIDSVMSRIGGLLTAQAPKGTKSAVISTVDDPGIWVQGFDSYLHQNPRGSSNGYNGNIIGTSMGFDTAVLDNFIFGLSGGYAWNHIKIKDFGNKLNADSYQGNIYGSYSNGTYYLDGIFSAAYNRYFSYRNISFGNVSRTARGEYGGQQYSVYLESGYTFKNNILWLTPLVSMEYSHLYLNKYTEEDAGDVDLEVGSQSYDLCQSGLGAKLAYPVSLGPCTVVPDVHFKWLYDFVGDNQQVTSTFTGGGASFSTNSFKPPRSSYNIGTKWTLLTKANVTLALNYDFEAKEDFYSHSGYINARLDF